MPNLLGLENVFGFDSSSILLRLLAVEVDFADLFRYARQLGFYLLSSQKEEVCLPSADRACEISQAKKSDELVAPFFLP